MSARALLPHSSTTGRRLTSDDAAVGEAAAAVRASFRRSDADVSLAVLKMKMEPEVSGRCDARSRGIDETGLDNGYE